MDGFSSILIATNGKSDSSDDLEFQDVNQLIDPPGFMTAMVIIEFPLPRKPVPLSIARSGNCTILWIQTVLASQARPVLGVSTVFALWSLIVSLHKGSLPLMDETPMILPCT